MDRGDQMGGAGVGRAAGRGNRAGAPWPTSTDIGLLRVASRNNLPTMVIQFAAASGLTYTSYSHAPLWYGFWMGVVAVVWLARLWLDRAMSRRLNAPAGVRMSEVRALARAHAAGLVISAGLWALQAVVRLPVEDMLSRFITLIILSALAGGAIGVLAPLRITGRIYITLILVPACAMLLFGPQGQTLLGVLGMFFWAVMIAGHRNNHAILVRSIELADENLTLVEELKARNAEVDRVNQSLEQRVFERTAELQAMAVKADAANSAKSSFLATISHEIRTPLNGVMGMVQVMLRDTLAPAQRERLAVVQTSAQALLGIVNDVLDVSKIEAGKMELSAKAFSLDAFARDLGGLYAVLAQEKGLVFALTTPEGGLGARIGDEARLRQIAGNLISNALKFTEVGEVGVAIEADDSHVRLTVRDTGIGIPLEDQALVLDKFVQVDGSNTRRAGGTGLGLAICRDLAQLMGGDLSFQSTPGVGSSFQITVPMARADSPAARSPLPERETAPSGSPRILVVDDNPTNQIVLKALLEQFGLASAAASDGREAVQAWRAQPWDVILMDVNMPGMDGLDATRAIRTLEREGQRPRTPIIAVTASVLDHETDRYRAAGMDDVLAKPIDARELAERLNRQMGAVEDAGTEMHG